MLKKKLADLESKQDDAFDDMSLRDSRVEARKVAEDNQVVFDFTTNKTGQFLFDFAYLTL